MFVSASVLQCKKEGDIIKGLNRSFTGTADSTVFAAFYESNTVNPDVNDVMKFRGSNHYS
ncbi:MAG: hypothetical protein IPJ60_19305 [Sphingobacteriaceae bacterium]|nr:hypothetical protein [Sphingobacteriaceae bacterium]